MALSIMLCCFNLPLTHTSRCSLFVVFTSRMCLWGASHVHNHWIKGSTTHLQMFRKLVLASWSPLSSKSLFCHTQFFFLNIVPDVNHLNRKHYSPTGQAMIRSPTSDLPIFLCTLLEHCASPACTSTVMTEHPLHRKGHGRGLKTWCRGLHERNGEGYNRRYEVTQMACCILAVFLSFSIS